MENLTEEQRENAKPFDDIYPPIGAEYLGSERFSRQTISGRIYYWKTPDGTIWVDDDQVRQLKIRRYVERKKS